MIKLPWPELVIQIEKYHNEKYKTNKSWSVKKTAKGLNRSVGSISEALNLASWLRSHPKLADIPNLTEALEVMKKKKKELRIR